jgi:hypothetical protein
VRRKIPIGGPWLVPVTTGVLLILVAKFVDLRPVVDENFFFSTSDPGVREQKTIEKHFPSKPEIILAISAPEISSPHYLASLQKLSGANSAPDRAPICNPRIPPRSRSRMVHTDWDRFKEVPD